MKKSQKTLTLLVLLIGIAIIGFTTYQLTQTNQSASRNSGKALIGGDFTLTDQNGKTVTNKDFEGKYALIYFGYTYCPDVCPTELQVMTSALEMLGDDAKKVQPIFISIDPDRDTPELMKDYVSNFFPGMVGLTGTKEQVAIAAKAYRVYYSKAVEKGADADSYAMDHSSIIYLMGPKGQFLKHFAYGTDPAKLAKDVKAATKG